MRFLYCRVMCALLVVSGLCSAQWHGVIVSDHDGWGWWCDSGRWWPPPSPRVLCLLSLISVWVSGSVMWGPKPYLATPIPAAQNWSPVTSSDHPGIVQRRSFLLASLSNRESDANDIEEMSDFCRRMQSNYIQESWNLSAINNKSHFTILKCRDYLCIFMISMSLHVTCYMFSKMSCSWRVCDSQKSWRIQNFR